MRDRWCAGTWRALIVDDDPVARGLLEVALETLGVVCESVADGNAAVARLDGEPVDLVLLDVRLPYRSGIDVLYELRSRPEWDDTAVIVVTGCDTEEVVLLALEGDADDVVLKPFGVPELRARAARRLRARRGAAGPDCSTGLVVQVA